MRAFFFVVAFLTMAMAAPLAIANDVYVPAAEQTKRDSDKKTILQREIEQEKLLILNKTHELAVVETSKNTQRRDELAGEIIQHQLNIELIQKEIEKAGSQKITRAAASSRNSARATSKNEPATTGQWWDTYSRNSSSQNF